MHQNIYAVFIIIYNLKSKTKSEVIKIFFFYLFLVFFMPFGLFNTRDAVRITKYILG